MQPTLTFVTVSSCVASCRITCRGVPAVMRPSTI